MSRTYRPCLWILTVLVSITAVRSAPAQSLWKRRVPQKSFMFYDNQARQVGDILTVLVNETTDVANQDQRALDRDTSANGGFTFGGALGGSLGTKTGDADVNMDTSGSGSFDGSSAYSVKRGFTDRITVTVVQRLPNGNLIVRGRRNRVVAGERRALTVSGIVRPLDVRADNTVESQYVADFNICYAGDGIESRFTEQGWVTRAWNKYRLF